MFRAQSDNGFSLVEALVALAVFATAGVALVQLQTHSLSTFSRVETSALADTVVQNTLTRILTERNAPPVGVRTQELTFAGRVWTVNMTVASTGGGVPMRRITIAVGATQDHPVSSGTAFMPTLDAAP